MEDREEKEKTAELASEAIPFAEGRESRNSGYWEGSMFSVDRLPFGSTEFLMSETAPRSRLLISESSKVVCLRPRCPKAVFWRDGAFCNPLKTFVDEFCPSIPERVD